MGTVTIEGTQTPSVYLGRGKRRTVEVTDFIRTLVRIGAVKVVEGSLKGVPQFASGGLIGSRPDDDSIPALLDHGHTLPADPDRLGVLKQMQAEEDGPGDPEHNQFPDADPPADKPKSKRRQAEPVADEPSQESDGEG